MGKPKKPIFTNPIYENIPAFLTGYKSWVLWQARYKGKTWTKVPIDPKSVIAGKPKTAKANDHTSWASFDQAREALESSNGRYDGIGLVLTENDPLIGLDFDNCVDCESEKGGIIAPFDSYVDQLNTYTEFSPSGKGLRVIARGKLPNNHHCRKGSQIEVYSKARYLTITGAVIDGRREVRNADPEVNEFYNFIFKGKPAKSAIVNSEPTKIPPIKKTLLNKALNSKDAKFKQLWAGDWSGYATHSEGDAALLEKLAFWTNNDAGQMEAMFNESGLTRDKWQDRPDYRQMSINKAIGWSTETYQAGERMENSGKESGQKAGNRKPIQNLPEQVRNYVDSIEGVFGVRELYDDLCLREAEEKKQARAALSNLAKKGVIENIKNRVGVWRKIERELQEMNLLDAEVENVELNLSLGLHGLVNFHPGNIILVAGDVDAGKTGFMLNAVRDNVDRFDIHYFSSEMGVQEIKSRILLFDDFPVLDHPNMHFYERGSDFQDVIRAGCGNLNIIDYLEIVENFYEIGRYVKDIHDTLAGAIAIIAVQKRDQFSDNPIGGVRGLEKPRLAVSLKKGGTALILKAKNWKTSINPNGLLRKYKLVQGCRFVPQGTWKEPDDAD